MVDAIRDDPTFIQPVARAMGAVNLHNLFTQVSHPDATVAQRLDFQRMINKLGQLEPEATQAAPGAGFSITINIPATPTTLGTVIEAKSERLPDPDDEEQDT